MHAHFKNRPNCYSNHHTDKPHHLPSQSRLFQSEAKPICTSPLQEIQPSLLHSLLLLYSGIASKTTHDVSLLFTRQGEQTCCFSLAPLAFFFSLFIYLTSVALEQPAVMLEQTSNNRLAVLRDIPAA